MAEFHFKQIDQIQNINRLSKLPLHQQLYEILRGKILQGEWQEGDQIPSESELMNFYSVSRITVRQVLNRLVNESLIYREQGRGSFVSERTLEEGLTRIISFTEDMHQRGLSPQTQIIFSGIVPSPPEVAVHLGIKPGEEMVRLDRLRLANEKPLSIEESFLVHRYCPGILDGDYALEPLREALNSKYGIQLVRAKQAIRAVLATIDQARLLTISTRSPLLYLERISFSQMDVPVEYLRIYYRGDRYSLHNELHD